MDRRRQYRVVAAIDIGTSYSGYAFSSGTEIEKDPTTISVILSKESLRGLTTAKLPTCVLFDTNKKFHSFGFEAEDMYAYLTENDEQKDWYFFKHFRMELFSRKTVDKHFSMKDELGKRFPAIDVFSASIGYLKNRLLKQRHPLTVDISESDILWVVTVPAIWNEGAKLFIREAAEKAGISYEDLLLACEPDVAALYCRSLPADKLLDVSGNKLLHVSEGSSPFTPGSKYLLLDAGGMTVQTTVHEVNIDGTITELYHASSGNLGAAYVDQAFLRLLSNIFGEAVMKQWKKNNMVHVLHLQYEFEIKKRSFRSQWCDMTIKIPFSLVETFKTKKGKHIKDATPSKKYSDQIQWIGDKLRVKSPVVEETFEPVNNGIIQHLQRLFKDKIVRDVPTVLLVGGFSESPMLQASIHKHFPNKRIIIPKDAGLAVLKGAVKSAQSPRGIDTCKERIEKHRLVVAIDFGTAYSGFAFSMKDDFYKDPIKISSVTWNSSRSLQSLKTPTCALFDPNKRFHSFGYEAEDKYADLTLDDKHQDWYFFKHFKMNLFNKMRVQRNFALQDELDKPLPAIDVFSASIGYLKDKLAKTCRDRFPDIEESEMFWVVTLPAIWNEGAKQFMRQAAVKAGINEENLLLALEPEAASLYCRSLKVEKLVDSTGGLSPFSPGSKYLVLDAGGGTVDVTVHEVKPDRTLAELYRASGGNWGGTYVDQAFLRLLSDIVGEDVMSKCKEQNLLDMLDLLREFEVKKRTFEPKMDGKIMLKVPVVLIDTFNAKKGKAIQDTISSTKYSNLISWITDKLRVEASVVKDLFTDVTNGIVNHLKMLFKEEVVRDVPTILMVGGFSESPMLQTSIRKHFPGKRIIIPEEAGLAVLKGAVIYGHDPSVISERRCRYTYGFETNTALSSMKNIKIGSIPENRQFVDRKGTMRVKAAFDKHTTIGQRMETGKPQSSEVYHSESGGDVVLRLFASTEPDPVYTDDRSCRLLGTLDVDVGHLVDTRITVSLTFSDTEILVEASKVATGEKLNAKFRFLE